MIAAEPVAGGAARRLLEAYLQEIAERFDVRIEQRGSASAGAGLAPPEGRFLVLRVGGAARGCGGVRTIAPGVGEVKRMWIEPGARGSGLGRRLLTALEVAAVDLGHRELRLDTHVALGSAMGLYRAAGYREVPPYNDNPDATHWFARTL